jgi:hypothetical protein
MSENIKKKKKTAPILLDKCKNFLGTTCPFFRIVQIFFDPENGSSRLLQNIVAYVTNYTLKHYIIKKYSM